MRRFEPQTRPTIQRRAVSLAAVVAMGALVLSACSSSKNNSATPPASGATSVPASTASSCEKQVAALVAQHIAARSQDWYPKPLTSIPSVAGKTYWIVTLNSAVPTVAAVTDTDARPGM